MSEKRGEYKVDSIISDKRRLQLMAKRIIDLGKDLEKLTEEEKKIVIEKVDEQYSYALVELYNTILEYMK